MPDSGAGRRALSTCGHACDSQSPTGLLPPPFTPAHTSTSSCSHLHGHLRHDPEEAESADETLGVVGLVYLTIGIHPLDVAYQLTEGGGARGVAAVCA